MTRSRSSSQLCPPCPGNSRSSMTSATRSHGPYPWPQATGPPRRDPCHRLDHQEPSLDPSQEKGNWPSDADGTWGMCEELPEREPAATQLQKTQTQCKEAERRAVGAWRSRQWLSHWFLEQSYFPGPHPSSESPLACTQLLCPYSSYNAESHSTRGLNKSKTKQNSSFNLSNLTFPCSREAELACP